MEIPETKCVWSTEDVLELKPEWTEEQATLFLQRNANTISTRMTEFGWDLIEQLLKGEE